MKPASNPERFSLPCRRMAGQAVREVSAPILTFVSFMTSR